MSVRYDDSLPTLVRTVRAEMGDAFSTSGVIVLRDATGRLGVAFEKRRKSQGLAAKLRESLGAYALEEPLLPKGLFDTIEKAGPRDVAIAMGDGEFVWLRLLDRRIIGSDWLGEFAPPPAGPPRLIFGSVKGGVGRSTALAVLAADLAQHGKRVLCVDLDLEAPGLSTMLLSNRGEDDRRPLFGVLDYLVENGLAGISDEDLFDFIGISHFANGLIHVLPAVGRVTDNHPENMIGKLARGLIEDVASNGTQSVAAQVREMIDRFVGRGEYDAVLVDARAGLAEITAGAWLALGARKLILFGTSQPQTFAGYRYLLAHLIQTLGVPDTSDDNEWRSRLTFVHSKAPSAGEGRLRFRDQLYELCYESLYDADDASDGELGFNFSFDDTGENVPHDATMITYHPDYDAFDPMNEGSLLEPGVYRGPFSEFLERAWRLLEWKKNE